MRKRILTAVCTFAAVAVPATAVAQVAHTPKSLRHAYLARYHKVRREQGKRAPGKNIVNSGSASQLRRSIATLDNMLAPAPAPSTSNGQTGVQQSTPSPAAPAPATASSSGGGGCTGMSAESGSSGYNNNSSPGYIGCYQISADHYAAGGSCAGLGTDPAGQDACAAIICRTEGTGAWTNPQGQNPCGRLGGG